MARKKLSDLARPEPVEYEGDDGSVLFSMPRRVGHLSPLEIKAWEVLSEASTDALADLMSVLSEQQKEGADSTSDEAVAKRDAARSALQDANFAATEFVLPGLTREIFDTIPNTTLAEIFKEFRTPPKAQATDAPETSGSVAT